MRRFDNLCNKKTKHTTVNRNNLNFTQSMQIENGEPTIMLRDQELTNLRRFCKMSNRSLISSCFLQFSINDHNQALGGIDRFIFTDCSILSYSSFTTSAPNQEKKILLKQLKHQFETIYTKAKLQPVEPPSTVLASEEKGALNVIILHIVCCSIGRR